MQVVVRKELLHNCFSFDIRKAIRYYSFAKLVSNNDHVRALLRLRQASDKVHGYLGLDLVGN